jgi:uncharacterized membrane protein YkgB
MKIRKGLGIAALVLAVLGAFLPVVGLYIGWIGLLVATIAAYLGERGLGIATVVVSAVAFLFLTPSLWVNAAGAAFWQAADHAEGAQTLGAFLVISGVLLVAPLVAMFVGRRRAEVT